MQQHVYDIAQFILDLSEIPSTDPLVHSEGSGKERLIVKTIPLNRQEFVLDTAWNPLLKTAIQNKRGADLDSLCLALGTIEWEYKGKTVLSPLILQPLEWKINKTQQTVVIRWEEQTAIINPFVKNQLVRNYEWNPEEKEFADPIDLLNDFIIQLEKAMVPGTISELFGIGHYHHHRYQILRELEGIVQAPEQSPLVQSILGNEAAVSPMPIPLTAELLSPADPDQLQVFDQLATENVVIQGPPGTGKSQVLANILGKMLIGDGLTLVVSEKRVALEVLVRKLREYELDVFTFTAHSQSQPKEFIGQLKSTWQSLEELREPVPPSLLLSKQLKDSLQLLLDRLNSPQLMGGVSLSVFRKLEAETEKTDVPFRSDTPTVSEWLDARDKVNELEQQLGSFELLKPFRPALLQHPNFDRLIRHLFSEITFLETHFAVTTRNELESLHQSVARCQLISNEAFHAYFELSSKPREYKRFQKLRLQFRELSERSELLVAEKMLWKNPPTRTEAVSWLDALNKQQSWFATRKWKKKLSAALNTTTVSPEIALKNWITYLDLQEELIALKRQFAEWGIERPEVELESAAYVLRQLQQEDPNELNQVAALSPEQQKRILSNAERIKRAQQDFDRYLALAGDESFSGKWRETEIIIHQLLAVSSLLKNIPEYIFRLFSSAKTTRELQAIVLFSNRRLLERQFPELAQFDGTVLEDKINKIVQTESIEFLQFARRLWMIRQQRFNEYMTLLRTPGAKITGKDKEIRSKLKSGKAILVKEFGKSRQHKTIRELLASDARIWIELLTPLWLSTPVQVGKTFPMERNLFDLAIFDEASQIPLPNALGTLQRSKHAVIAGDEQQMAPSAYFSGSRVAVDLLHQASWYWKKIPLRHHYRSEHPALIAFSNRHFYRNELVAYPAAHSVYPLHWHHIAGGIYSDRVNHVEAIAVAHFLETLPTGKSLGVIAFSEQQLECIWQHCSPQLQERITKSQEKDAIFFKALEQIQGDEADLIVISLGYARNTEGEFHMRFGPLNQSKGFKRLNVLLTRAKSQLHFFTSVTAADFSISANESVNLLRLFLLQIEQENFYSTGIFPYGIPESARKKNTLVLPEIHNLIPNAHELINFQRVMSKRGWKLVY